MEGNTKPVLLFCSTPGYGHVMPLRVVAKDLVSRGYDVMYLTGNAYRSKVEDIGATFKPLLGLSDFSEGNVNHLFPDQDKDAPPSGPYRLPHSIRYIFVNTIPAQHKSVQAVLLEIKEKDPQRKIIIIQDFIFLGNFPILLGAPGIKPTGVISLGISPLMLSGPEIPPFGLSLPYDASPSGLARNKEMYIFRNEELFGELTKHLGNVFKELGAEPPQDFLMDMEVLVPDRFLQMCIPELEYPRLNPPAGLRFTGGLPQGHRDAAKEKPKWWDDIAVNASAKKIVAVSQGTATNLYQKLIIPTLQGLADCEDILVVAALGKEGAVLPEDTVISANARVGDFIPFDELFPHADVFITNGGYGGYQHAVSHGVPLIVAGVAADKPEVAARVEWAGLGINMRTETPSPEAVREAVEKVLADGKYQARARELEKEIQKYDPFAIVMENIEELAAREV